LGRCRDCLIIIIPEKNNAAPINMAKIINQIATDTRNPPIPMSAHTVPKKAINITPEAVPRTSAFVTTSSVTLTHPPMSIIDWKTRTTSYRKELYIAISSYYTVIKKLDLHGNATITSMTLSYINSSILRLDYLL